MQECCSVPDEPGGKPSSLPILSQEKNISSEIPKINWKNFRKIEYSRFNKTQNTFRKNFFPSATTKDWNDWKWQLRNRIRNLDGLQKIFNLTETETDAVKKLGNHLPVGITPYYASLCSITDAKEALRSTMIPVAEELYTTTGESKDPLSEDNSSPVPGIVHRYPDRILFLVTNFCATYCRYCTRARMVGQTGEYHFNTKQFQLGIEYIKQHTEIRDVLLSGGDPLSMDDNRLLWLLEQLRSIPHVEFVRIGTKIPAVLPQRITRKLCRLLQEYEVWLSVHFMHPKEVTPSVSEACLMLANHGIPLGSQTVLLKNVNDDVAIMKQLMHKLLMIKVRPYYLYQCDPISGSAHMRTSIEKGIEIIDGLRGHTTGYAVPHFVVDAPGGGGKIPLLPNYMLSRDDDYVLFRNFEGKLFKYYDPENSEQDIINLAIDQKDLIAV